MPSISWIIMVFKSQNNDRKCKYCAKPPKINLSSGRNKGYYRTCGSSECLTQQYRDRYVCLSKGKLKQKIDYICFCCGEKFIGQSQNHKRFCLECVPDKSWRGRASRYGIGKKQWDIMLQKQDSKCALCERNPEVVDHCHRSGKVRGLLCGKCNMYLTAVEFNNGWLDKALVYAGGK